MPTWRERNRLRVRSLAFLILASWTSPARTTSALPAGEKAQLPAIRWQEGQPGCTFSRSNDGKFYYGLWSGDVGIMLGVDAQELQKVHRRHEPFLSVLLTVHYRGPGSLELSNENISLEFISHFKVVQTSLDPDAFAEKVQNDADTVDHQAAREIEKHPEEKDKKQAYVRAFQKDTAELVEFIGKNSLRSMRLNPAHTETSGWVLFSTNSKWIGHWKKQEDFVLRFPIEGTVYEFPFRLPPQPGEIILRKRQ
jgi:hypothetical protein